MSVNRLQALIDVLRPFLVAQAKDFGRTRIAYKLRAAQVKIAERMAKDSVKNAALWASGGDRHVIRYTLYWLCKALAGSGSLADYWRDQIDDDIVAAVLEQGFPETGRQGALLEATASAFKRHLDAVIERL